MDVSVWQAWRSLRHKAGCTLRQSLRLWIRWVRHRSWTWTEPQSPILSNKPLDKLEVTSRLLLWKQERQSHCRLRLHVSRISVFLPFFFLGNLKNNFIGSHGRSGWELRRLYRFLSCHLFGPVNHGQTWKGWERSGEKGLIIKIKLDWLSRSMILPLGTFPWLSLSVIHGKTSLKGLILIILSTYQAW